MLPYHPPPADHAPPSSSPSPGRFPHSPRNPGTRVTEGREVGSGSGGEAAEEAGPVLHPPQPGLHQRGQLAGTAFSQAGQGSPQVRPHRFSRLVTVQGALARRVRVRRLSTRRVCFGWSGGLSGCGRVPRRGPGRRRRCERGNPLRMAVTRIPETALWPSFPDANRNEVLGLLEHAPGTAGGSGQGVGGGRR
jgi:hypothetical protein